MSRLQRRPAHRITAAAATFVLAAVAPATAQSQFPAVLAGHAILPAASFVAAPSDTPDSLKLSGKYTTPDGRRRDVPGSVPGTSFLSDRTAPRPTGLHLPFAVGQPVQGFSGIKAAQGRDLLGAHRQWLRQQAQLTPMPCSCFTACGRLAPRHR